MDPGCLPETLAYGLTDSLAGLAAWIVERFHAWSDCVGNPEDAISRDEMLASISAAPGPSCLKAATSPLSSSPTFLRKI